MITPTAIPSSHSVRPPKDAAVPERAHLVGIAGSGMRSLAGVLLAGGCQVTGSDAGDVAGLPAAFRAKLGHSTDYLNDRPELVIYSPAIDQHHAELVAARQHGIPTVSYPEMLGRLMAGRMGIAVAGTHGKSTVVAMLTSILQAAGLDPLVLCGAECSRSGRGPHMLAEACEYRSSFLHLRPKLAAILNVEPDHFDYYHSRDHLDSEFLTFARSVAEQGRLIVGADCPSALRIAAGGQISHTTFGAEHEADMQARVLSCMRGRRRFQLVEQGSVVGEIGLSVPGRHNLRNALAAAALARSAGLEYSHIVQGLEYFTGLKRRLQTLGTVEGITVIDDFAHHPTEIDAALESVREQFPGAKIACIFEPHQANRTQSLRDELASSLKKADTLAVMEIFRAREGVWQAGEITADEFAAQIRASGIDTCQAHATEQICDWILHQVSKGLIARGDVVLTLGAGRIGKLAHDIYQRIREICPDR